MTVFRLIETSAQLAEVVASVREEPRYALDTEFHRERTYFPKLALVQLAWSGGLVLIDPLAVDPQPLAELLRGPGTAVLHAAEQDLEILEQACGVAPGRIFDTQLAAGFVGMSAPSLSALHERFLGFRLPKGDRLTDWLARPLSEAQLSYAASDVEHLLAIRDQLVQELDELGRLGWAEAECAELEDRRRGPRDAQEAWSRIKEARQLKGRKLAVAQAVAAWREERAAALDLPPRYVLPDLGVVAVANAVPRTVRALRETRGVDGRALRDGAAEELLEVVRTGLDQPPPERTTRGGPQIDRRLRPAVTLVSAWVSQLARDLAVDAALLATRADIEAFLRGDEDARLAHGWRAEVAGEPVRRLVHGEAALAFDGDGGLVLEDRATPG